MIRSLLATAATIAVMGVVVLSPEPALSAYETSRSAPPMPQVAADLSVYDRVSSLGDAQGYAEPYCDSREVLTQTIAQDFAETPRLSQLRDDATRVEVWGSDLMDTWTMIYTRADGVSCVIDSGTDWSKADPQALLARRGAV